MKFSEFNLDPQIISSLESAGYQECMDVQAKTLEHTLDGKDILVQSQTGTGKTAAFLVSIFALLRSGTLKHSKAMIIAPTRELAVQIEEEALLLGYNLNFGICSFYGGVGYRRQEDHLAKGVDILIGTPGRVLDFKNSRRINFKEIGIFVIDEADRLFDMGFLPDIINMLRSLPPSSERQTMLFSATLSPGVKKIAREYMHDPAEVEIESEQMTVDAITQEIIHVSNSEKMNLLLGILKKENPANVLIFTNMKGEARVVSERLRHNGYTCEYLSGDLPQAKRSRILEQVKNGTIKYLVATDVAARGIHIDDLELVINYDIPEHCENYVHRIGRTARAGKTGKAISLACEDYVHGLKLIEEFTKAKIPVVFADSDMYIEDSSAGIKFHRTDRGSGDRNANRRSSSGGGAGRSGPRSGQRQSQRGTGSNQGRPQGQSRSKQSYGKNGGRANPNRSTSSSKTRSQNSSNTPQPRTVKIPIQATSVPTAEKKVSWFKKVVGKVLNR